MRCAQLAGFGLLLSAVSVQADASVVLALQTSQAQNDAQEKTHDRLQLHGSDASQLSWQLQHDYRVFALPTDAGIAAASNGHVHQLAVAVTSEHDQWRATLQPVLATSSNALRHSQQLRAADLQWHGALLAQTDHDATSAWYYGLRADSRLGRYRLYPSLQWQTEPAADWQLALGWPDSQLDWQVQPSLRMQWMLAPDGGQWQVRDDTFTHSSELRYQQWQALWRLQWSPAEPVQLTLSLAREFDQQLRYRLLDGRVSQQRSEAGNSLTIAVSLTF